MAASRVGASESTLYPWQRSVLAGLQDVKQSLRLDFVTEVMSQSKEQLEAKLELLVKLNRLPSSSFDVVNNLVNELSKTKK